MIFYQKIFLVGGKKFEKENYIELSKKLIDAEKLFLNIHELKEKMDASIKKDILQKVKSGIEWLSIYGNSK